MSGGGPRSEKLSRLSGRLRATLGYSSVDEIMATGVVAYLHNIQKNAQDIHLAIYELYIKYSIQAALAG